MGAGTRQRWSLLPSATQVALSTTDATAGAHSKSSGVQSSGTAPSACYAFLTTAIAVSFSATNVTTAATAAITTTIGIALAYLATAIFIMGRKQTTISGGERCAWRDGCHTVHFHRGYCPMLPQARGASQPACPKASIQTTQVLLPSVGVPGSGCG